MSEFLISTKELDKDSWHAVLTQFRDASVMQTRSYATARWPRAKLNHVVVTRNGKPLVAAQVLLWSPPLVGGGLAYIHFGPMWLPYSGQLDAHGLRWALQRIADEYAGRRRMLLRIKPQALPAMDTSAVALALRKLGFVHTPDPNPNRFHVDVTKSNDELRLELHRSWRRNLRHAERHALDIVQDTGSGAVQGFLQLYAQMSARKGFVDNSAIDVLPSLYADLPAAMTPVVFHCQHEGRSVASIVIATAGESALYLFGASGNAALKLRAGYRLHWFAIGWLREHGCRWYDLGGDDGDHGLYRFKSGLVGNSSHLSMLPGEFQMAGNWVSELGVGLGFRVRGLVRTARRRLRQLGHR